MNTDPFYNVNPESFYGGMSENYDSDLNERDEDVGTRKIDTSKITNMKFDDIDTSDYPDFCDAFICSADMDGHEMTEDEIYDLNENHKDFVHEKLFEYLF